MKRSIEKKNKIFFIEKLLKSIDDLRIVRYNKIRKRDRRIDYYI